LDQEEKAYFLKSLGLQDN